MKQLNLKATYCKICKKPDAGQPGGYCRSCATDLIEPPPAKAKPKPRCPQCNAVGELYPGAIDQYVCTGTSCRSMFEVVSPAEMLDDRPHVNAEKREQDQARKAKAGHNGQQAFGGLFGSSRPRPNQLQPPRGPNRTH